MPIFGGDSTKSSKDDHHTRGQKDHSDAVIDPALRSLPSSPSSDKKRHENDTSLVNQASQDHPSPMPLRVEPFQMSSSPRRHHFDTSAHSHRLPSPPPPITTMSSNSHSPSPSVVSVDRSSNSTPHIRRSPPHNPIQPAMYPSSYQHDPPMMQSARHHYPSPREPINHGTYIYATHPPFDPQPRYDHHQQHPDNRQPYPTPSGLPAHFPAPMSHPQQMHDYGRQYPMPGQPPVTTVLTDDAATKLTDGIRRRCFNCCTTDTSTWRRSNLSPGKVLCNKCGLFERTHSRPRPDQFPHKRGPLATSTLRGRTPPSSNQLPPIGSAAPYHQYHHQAITPVNTGEYHPNTTLPGLQTWHGGNSSTGSSNGNASSGGNSNNGNGGSNSHTITGPGGSSGGGGESHSNSHSNSNSASGTPLLANRRPTLESPRLHAHSSPRVRPFDEPLTSNAAESHHAPSPPSTISRSSTSNTTGGSSAHQESSSVSHTPSPAARDAPA